MKILYHIEDDWILDSEDIEIEISNIIDIPKEKENNKYLLSIGLNIAKLRGHTSTTKDCIKIINIT